VKPFASIRKAALIAFLVAAAAYGSPARAEYFAGIGTGFRTRDQSLNGLGLNRVDSFAVGHLWDEWSAAAELNEIRNESGAGNTLVTSRQLEATLWVRKHLVPHFWHPFVALGLGGQQERVETHFAGTVTGNQGETTRMMGLSLGVQGAGAEDGVGFIVEFRYLNGSGFRTLTLYETVSRLTFRF